MKLTHMAAKCIDVVLVATTNHGIPEFPLLAEGKHRCPKLPRIASNCSSWFWLVLGLGPKTAQNRLSGVGLGQLLGLGPKKLKIVLLGQGKKSLQAKVV